MNVLAITESPDRPTVETFIGLYKKNINISVICRSNCEHKTILDQHKIKNFEIVFRRKIDYEAIKKLRNYLIDQKVDIVHVFSNNTLTNTIFSLIGLKNIKLIAYRGIVGNVSYFDPISWIRFLNPRINKIICVCDAIKNYFLSMRPKFLRMNSNKPIRIYKGHNVDWYNEVADLNQYSIPANSFVVGCVANSRPRKGVDYLIRAIDLVPENIPIVLLLIGRMRGRKIKQAIKQSKRKNLIFSPGFCENAPAISAACDLVCLPSYKREGLPRSIIEAMSAAVPPIVTNSGGSPELVEDNISGIVVPVRDSQSIADAIKKLYFDESLRKSMGQKARERIKLKFNNEITVNETLNVYQDLHADQTK